jgi:hypothetical protein
MLGPGETSKKRNKFDTRVLKIVYISGVVSGLIRTVRRAENAVFSNWSGLLKPTEMRADF